MYVFVIISTVLLSCRKANICKANRQPSFRAHTDGAAAPNKRMHSARTERPGFDPRSFILKPLVEAFGRYGADGEQLLD